MFCKDEYSVINIGLMQKDAKAYFASSCFSLPKISTCKDVTHIGHSHDENKLSNFYCKLVLSSYTFCWRQEKPCFIAPLKHK